MIIGIIAAFAIFTGGNAILDSYTKCNTVIVKQVVVAAGTTEETRECKE